MQNCKPQGRNMVGCEDQSTEGIPKRDFTNYPQTWSFNVKRESRGLVCYAQGYDLQEGFFNVMLAFENKKWVVVKIVGADDRQDMSHEVKNEFFRQFAAHKARYLHKRKCKT